MKLHKGNMDELMFDLLEGNLSSDEAAELMRQIEADPYMRYQFSVWQQTLTAKADFVIAEDQAFVESLIRKPEKKRIYMLPYLSAAAVLIIAAFISYHVYRSKPLPAVVHTKPAAIQKEKHEDRQRAGEAIVSAAPAGKENRHAEQKDSKPEPLIVLPAPAYEPLPAEPVDIAEQQPVQEEKPLQPAAEETIPAPKKTVKSYAVVAVTKNTASDMVPAETSTVTISEWPGLLTNTKLRFRKRGDEPAILVEGEDRQILVVNLSTNKTRF